LIIQVRLGLVYKPGSAKVGLVRLTVGLVVVVVIGGSETIKSN